MSGVQVLGDDWDDGNGDGAGDGGGLDDDLPDELGWLPGELGEPRTLLTDGEVHLLLQRSLVHPNGVLVTVEVRLLHTPSHRSPVGDPDHLLSEAAVDDVRRRRLADEVLSFRDPELGGPRLARRDPVTGEAQPALPWAQGGSTDAKGGRWTLPYWVSMDPMQPWPLWVTFEWPTRSIVVDLVHAADEVRAARSRARPLH
ncbi:hypothetical protein DFJ68_2749 [Terracoccus luteus]|uniref:Uncharacterized protein n=1 Tax=Terracoccus luteus TaxID=53356 RepID=A0A495XZB7_9MICO|nr:hypothetical protein [Terracoccus luteus]RKT79282.1 hypothetical protein DFJ68_2749 [Terracoccus luteus]